MRLLTVLVGVLTLYAGAVEAAALRVAPVGLDLGVGQHASTLTLRNDGADVLNVQVRVFRWRQHDGKDQLEPATDVVVSPPISRVDAGGSRIIRVVRTATAPVMSEEAYRILVDELPPPPSDGGRMVTLLMRHSIPLFFGADGNAADIAWNIEHTDSGVVLKADNKGGRRIRIADVRLLNGEGESVAEHRGLVGYVLPGSTMRWPVGQADASALKQLLLTTDLGPVNVTLSAP